MKCQFDLFIGRKYISRSKKEAQAFTKFWGEHCMVKRVKVAPTVGTDYNSKYRQSRICK